MLVDFIDYNNNVFIIVSQCSVSAYCIVRANNYFLMMIWGELQTFHFLLPAPQYHTSNSEDTDHH